MHYTYSFIFHSFLSPSFFFSSSVCNNPSTSIISHMLTISIVLLYTTTFLLPSLPSLPYLLSELLPYFYPFISSCGIHHPSFDFLDEQSFFFFFFFSFSPECFACSFFYHKILFFLDGCIFFFFLEILKKKQVIFLFFEVLVE